MTPALLWSPSSDLLDRSYGVQPLPPVTGAGVCENAIDPAANNAITATAIVFSAFI